MPSEEAISRGELRANARPLVMLRAEQDAFGNADADGDFMHQVLHEARERLRRTRRHHLDAISRPEVLDRGDLGELVLLILAGRQDLRGRRLEQVARVGRGTVVEDQRGLL